MTATSRTVALLDAVDAWARESEGCTVLGLPDECLALRHLCECLTRIVQAHPLVAEFAETYAARAAAALDLVEEE